MEYDTLIKMRCLEPCCEAPLCRVFVEIKNTASEAEKSRCMSLLKKDPDCPLFKE